MGQHHLKDLPSSKVTESRFLKDSDFLKSENKWRRLYNLSRNMVYSNLVSKLMAYEAEIPNLFKGSVEAEERFDAIRFAFREGDHDFIRKFLDEFYPQYEYHMTKRHIEERKASASHEANTKYRRRDEHGAL